MLSSKTTASNFIQPFSFRQRARFVTVRRALLSAHFRRFCGQEYPRYGQNENRSLRRAPEAVELFLRDGTMLFGYRFSHGIHNPEDGRKDKYAVIEYLFLCRHGAFRRRRQRPVEFGFPDQPVGRST